MTQTPEIKGYCPVAYFVAGEALEGKAEFSASHDGKLYHFVSREAKQEFERDPEKYIPAYGGHCAFGMSIEKEFEACPKHFKIVNDRLYLFLHNDETDARALWNKEDEAKCIANADKNWTDLHASADAK